MAITGLMKLPFVRCAASVKVGSQSVFAARSLNATVDAGMSAHPQKQLNLNCIVRYVTGRTVMTASLAAKGAVFIALAAQAVAGDTNFAEDSDPYGDHAFGAVTVAGEKLLWQIDLYDEHYEYGSPVPSDLQQTRRVLTIMFPYDD
ncbi:DUF3768 domain-containing protein [Sedimentitalea todarodis]|uniref:DUF3768 domain-containing protein n=1 Tax=Sedimentitalea todarodis TaxID=1631240 RepID=A0ABU3VII3_9RHOB|nr:DUF3768 domain-containing protein [Sedimentitalea todarodis]MDU9005504.1 DUF3768 domain-containing protein [Sedimentitalea todarodis]